MSYASATTASANIAGTTGPSGQVVTTAHPAATSPSGSLGWSGWASAGPAAFMGISAIGDTFANSQAKRAQAEYQQGIYNVNARFADIQSKDATFRGELAADEVIRRSQKNLSIIRSKVSEVKSGQRASFGAQGIDATSGSAADILADTEFKGALDEGDIKRNTELDVITIKNNAWREAWGYKTQGDIYRSQGRMSGMAGDTAVRNTLLTGGLRTLGYGLESYANYRKAA